MPQEIKKAFLSLLLLSPLLLAWCSTQEPQRCLPSEAPEPYHWPFCFVTDEYTIYQWNVTPINDEHLCDTLKKLFDEMWVYTDGKTSRVIREVVFREYDAYWKAYEREIEFLDKKRKTRLFYPWEHVFCQSKYDHSPITKRSYWEVLENNWTHIYVKFPFWKERLDPRECEFTTMWAEIDENLRYNEPVVPLF